MSEPSLEAEYYQIYTELKEKHPEWDDEQIKEYIEELSSKYHEQTGQS